MHLSFLLQLETWQLTVFLLLLMIAGIYIGRAVGNKLQKKPEADSTIIGALFGLLGLLLAFTFSLSVNYYDSRRETIIEEANDIGTAILRADLYPEADRKFFRAEFKKYLDARIDYFSVGADVRKILEAQELSIAIQNKIWAHVARFSKDSAYTVASMQMIPALNSMIDITNTRQYGNIVHLPDTVIYLLYLLSCACAFYIGYVSVDKTKIDWLMAGGFCLLTSIVVFVIFDMDRPLRGLIRLDEVNRSISELKGMFTE